MTKTIEIVERINSHANSWERDDALDAREPTEEARFWRETALTIEALAKALEPFARDADAWPRNADSDTLALTDPEGIASPYNITVGDLRRARSALPASDEKDSP